MLEDPRERIERRSVNHVMSLTKIQTYTKGKKGAVEGVKERKTERKLARGQQEDVQGKAAQKKKESTEQSRVGVRVCVCVSVS